MDRILLILLLSLVSFIQSFHTGDGQMDGSLPLKIQDCLISKVSHRLNIDVGDKIPVDKIMLVTFCLGVSFVDFAGSGIVHCTGGIAALMGAIFIGPRHGLYGPDGQKYTIPGHSVPIAALGGFILFLGFLAFNGGSQLAIVSDAGDAAAVSLVFMNTILGGAGGALAALVGHWINAKYRLKEEPKWSLLTCINGGLAGMVALCAGCNVLHQGTSLTSLDLKLTLCV